MIDKFFKIGLLIAIMVFLAIFYTSSQNDHYQVITEYEGSLGIFDTRKGVVYMLDVETDQWTVIRPFSPSRPAI